MQCRPAIPDDLSFILETFMRSIWAQSTHVEGYSQKRIGGLLSNLLTRPEWRATVIDSEGYLLGWAVHGERNRLAWVYIRDMARSAATFRWFLRELGTDLRRPIVTPFLPNRRKPRVRTRLINRPFEVVT